MTRQYVMLSPLGKPNEHAAPISRQVSQMKAVHQVATGTGKASRAPDPLYRWGLLVTRRRRVVFAIWAVLIAAGLAFVPRFISSLSLTGLRVPGSESSRAAALLARELPAAGGNQVVLVFSSPVISAATPDFERVVAATARNVSAIRGVSHVELPYGAAARDLIAPGGHTALAVVALSGSDEGKAEQLTPRIDAAAATAATASVHVGVTGEPSLARDLLSLLDTDLIRSEAVGLPVALIVLVIVFDSLVAAGLPLLLALGSLGVVLGGFGAYSAVTGSGINMLLESSTVLLTLGIGIDYALFIVTRFREELAAGTAPAGGAAAATATAGRTVLVSGSTVVIALAPVLIVNDPMMRDLVLGPMVAVAVLVAAALTLLPAVLAGLGSRVSALAPPHWGRPPRWPRLGERLTAFLLNRPLIVLVSVAVPLAALSLFTLQLHTGLDYGLSTVQNRPAGRADTAIAAAFGPGAISPVQIIISAGGAPLSGRDVQTLAKLDARLRSDPQIGAVASLPGLLGGARPAEQALAAARTDRKLAARLSPIVNVDGGSTLTVVTITPRASFDSARATQLVVHLRAELPVVLRGSGLHALVGGASAAIADFSHEINAKTPLVLALILILALLLLGVAFRSPLVALVGLCGTLLSVGAAYGLLVLVFQRGGGQAVFGFHSPGFIQSWLPLLLFAILTGLSTDYQVFLVSRVKEEWNHSGDAATAVVVGLRRSGPVILSAATIMVVVFASFLLASELELKELGFALAAVVLIDAALVRRLLVPAALRLLGRRAWTGRALHGTDR
jgi:RND superfamily putative drug exporter